MRIWMIPVLLSWGCQAAAPPKAPHESATSAEEKRTAALQAKTEALLTALSRGDVAAATRNFDVSMRAALPDEKLASLWRAIVLEVGELTAVESFRVTWEAGISLVLATCQFARTKLLVKVAYNEGDEVAGLFFLPAEGAAAIEWKPPAYAKLDAFNERSVQVGTAPALPGFLSLPKGKGPFPAVVLVHGSGPSDADESVGAIKMFKDLAFGLASRGIVALRYVKRSRFDPSGVVTQKEEVIDAAKAAAAFLLTSPTIDPARVVLIGHSQGGYLAPRIVEQDADITGIVVLAGPTRPLQDSLLTQYQYFSSLEPKNPEWPKALGLAKQFKATVEAPGLRPDQNVDVPGGGSATGAYFLDVRDYHPGRTAARLSCPMLVLQGGRDYQVTKVDFEGWQSALGHQARAKLHLYPALNHLFVAGSGPSTPAEYERPGHVDEQVIADIAKWIAELPSHVK